MYEQPEYSHQFLTSDAVFVVVVVIVVVIVAVIES